MGTIYWVSTALISGFLLFSSYTYFFSQNTIEGFRDLGFPDFFRIQLGVLKILAVIVLLIPSFPAHVKEWAYAGVGLFLLTALVAHIAHRDSIMITIFLLVLFVILGISNHYFQS
ncbi:MAG: DoxX family protein [Saprospiraceae bacterium]